MKDIQLKATLSAYSKFSIKEMLEKNNIILDVDNDGKLYGRKHGEWEVIELPKLTTPENSNLIIEKQGAIYNIQTKEYVGPESGITEWEEGWTYYITDEQESTKNEETV